jgi:tetratricopeptide (TPR) repeat protein
MRMIAVIFCTATMAFALAGDAAPSGRRLAQLDPDTRSGLSHLYDLEYDTAIADFERTYAAHPQDPFAVNHLLQAILLKELYRLNALDTTLYADNGFLTGKPLPGDLKVKARIQELSDRALALAEARLKTDPRDVDALYARGVTRGLKLSYVAIVEKSFFSALRHATASRHDHEKVLELDPAYTDAKLVVGLHNYIIGSLPLAAKVLIGIVGITGSKQKGLDYLAEVGRSSGDTSVDARVTLSLFLRREARYEDALSVQRSLIRQYPRNFLFALEEANLLKDAGRGEPAMQAYARILDDGRKGAFAAPHLERAAFGLAEVERGYRHPEAALQHYLEALAFSALEPDIRIRALLGAAMMRDVLGRRKEALRDYQQVIALDPESAHAAVARRHIKDPFRYPS